MKAIFNVAIASIFLVFGVASANKSHVFDKAAVKFLHENSPNKKILVLQWLLEKQITKLEDENNYESSKAYDMQLEIFSRQCKGNVRCATETGLNALKYVTISSGSVNNWMTKKGFNVILSSPTNDRNRLFESYSDGQYKIGIFYECNDVSGYGSVMCFVSDVVVP